MGSNIPHRQIKTQTTQLPMKVTAAELRELRLFRHCLVSVLAAQELPGLLGTSGEGGTRGF